MVVIITNMPFKIIEINGDKCISYCIFDDTNELEYYCHNENTQSTYMEKLNAITFSERIQQLNRRVQFPSNDVRNALINDDPFQIEMDNTSELKLKYRIGGAAPPFKWEWNLIPIDSIVFYRHMATDAMATASQLGEQITDLRKLLEKKDIELKQYKIEGAQLRRSTVATQPFDAIEFNAKNEHVLKNASVYSQLCQQMVKESKTQPQSHHSHHQQSTSIKCEAREPDVKTLSPRNKKRKAVEFGKKHLERKVLQRRQVPQQTYKDSQSEEFEVDNNDDAAADASNNNKHNLEQIEMKEIKLESHTDNDNEVIVNEIPVDPPLNLYVSDTDGSGDDNDDDNPTKELARFLADNNQFIEDIEKKGGTSN